MRWINRINKYKYNNTLITDTITIVNYTKLMINRNGNNY